MRHVFMPFHMRFDNGWYLFLVCVRLVNDYVLRLLDTFSTVNHRIWYLLSIILEVFTSWCFIHFLTHIGFSKKNYIYRISNNKIIVGH
jgi:intracellular septation protein A